jgi:BMFP domain-containing protein YqiC
MREWMGSQDMVSRDEFEAVKAIAVAAREESLALKARLDALEGKPAAAAAAPKAAAPRARKPKSEGPSPG